MISRSAIAAISVAILAYEVLLVRLFAIVQWHHFAFMAISVAMLGFGLSGALLAVFRGPASRRAVTLFPVFAALFSVTAPAAFLLAQRIPFNALEVIWSPWQLLNFAVIYLLLAIPFTAGATCIGLAFLLAGARTGKVYLWNMLGSGIGALGTAGALQWLHPITCLGAIAAIGFAASLLAGLDTRRVRVVIATVVVGLAGSVTWWAAPVEWRSLHISEHKDLTRALTVRGARRVQELSGPLALLTVVESPEVPFRHAPGLSMVSPALPPEQLGVFADGGFVATIDLWDGRPESLGYLDHTTDALAYHLTDRPVVLVLGAGGGQPVLQAIGHGAARIEAVERDPEMLRLVSELFADAAGQVFARNEVGTRIAEARHYLAATEGAWDLIRIASGGSGTAMGARGLVEDYLNTIEGFELIHRRLRPGGWLSATVHVQLPPRSTLKLVATIRGALEAAGEADPADRLIVIRGLTTATVLAKRGIVTPDDIARTKAFADARAFDLVYYPGMARDHANRRNRLSEPFFHDAVRALLGEESGAFISGYKFDIAPASDDRPYFHDFFKWTTLPELLAMGPMGASALLEMGELIVAATLVQALVLGLALVLLPLRARAYRKKPRAVTWRYGIYFTALGFAFLFVEIAWIQKFVLLLGHPVYAVATALAGFLVFAGLGAGLSGWIGRGLARLGLPLIAAAVTAIGAISLAYLVALPPIIDTMADLADLHRFALALLLIAPLAFFMGIPFPAGLAIVARRDSDFVPWAWGLNGCASVVSAAAAMIIAMNFGFSLTVVIAVVLYAVAALSIGTISSPSPRKQT